RLATEETSPGYLPPCLLYLPVSPCLQHASFLLFSAFFIICTLSHLLILPKPQHAHSSPASPSSSSGPSSSPSVPGPSSSSSASRPSAPSAPASRSSRPPGSDVQGAPDTADTAGAETHWKAGPGYWLYLFLSLLLSVSWALLILSALLFMLVNPADSKQHGAYPHVLAYAAGQVVTWLLALRVLLLYGKRKDQRLVGSARVWLFANAGAVLLLSAGVVLRFGSPGGLKAESGGAVGEGVLAGNSRGNFGVWSDFLTLVTLPVALLFGAFAVNGRPGWALPRAESQPSDVETIEDGLRTPLLIGGGAIRESHVAGKEKKQHRKSNLSRPTGKESGAEAGQGDKRRQSQLEQLQDEEEEEEQEQKKQQEEPPMTLYASADWLSALTFGWVSPFLEAGAEKTVAVEDVPSLQACDRAEANFRAFDASWARQVAEAEAAEAAAARGGGVGLIPFFSGPFSLSQACSCENLCTALYRCISVLSSCLHSLKSFLTSLYTSPYTQQEDSKDSATAEKTKEDKEEEGEQTQPKATVTRALWECFWRPLVLTGVLALGKTGVMYAGPLLLASFVQFAAGERAFPGEGVVLVVALFLSKASEIVLEHQFNFRSEVLGLDIKSALVGALYRKGLRLSSKAKQRHTIGEIVNYMSTDAQRLADLMWELHNIWVLPLQIVCALVILFHVVGISMLSGLGVMLAVMLANLLVASGIHRFITEIMSAKDARMKATSEALSSMKIIKLYAWQQHFQDKIQSLRDSEASWLVKFMAYAAVNIFLLWLTPLAVSVATFGTMVALGVPLTPASVFTAIATFRILQEPLRSFPSVISAVTQAMVSLKRLSRFLSDEELQWDAVERVGEGGGMGGEGMRDGLNGNGYGGNGGISQQQQDGEGEERGVEKGNEEPVEGKRKKEGDDDVVVRIENGTFSWDADPEKTTLTGVDLEIRRGMRVAVCGTVGAGKSSLLSCILGEVPKLQGKVFVSGPTAYVPQSAWIQNATIRDNILFGQPLDRARYHHTLHQCSLLADLRLFPLGADTQIGERGVNLSGGQKQRIQLARAMYAGVGMGAEVYLLDDPFSAVDAHTGSELFMIGERGVNLSGGQKQRIQLARAMYLGVGMGAEVYLLDDPFSAVDAHTGSELLMTGERGVNLSGGQKQRIQLARAMYAGVGMGAEVYLLDDPFSAVDAHTGSELLMTGERGVNLSGGQKQRIQLARAMYAGVGMGAEVYLLDDPFSAVDAHTGSELFMEYVLKGLAGKTVILEYVLKGLAGKTVILEYVLKGLAGKTVILVTHQVEFLPAADLILVMKEGRIVQSGNYVQLLAEGTDFSALVEGWMGRAHTDTPLSPLSLPPPKHHQVMKEGRIVQSGRYDQLLAEGTDFSALVMKEGRIVQSGRYDQLLAEGTDFSALVMKEGRIVQSGRYDQLLAEGTDFSALVEAHTDALESQPVDPIHSNPHLSQLRKQSAPNLRKSSEPNLLRKASHSQLRKMSDPMLLHTASPESHQILENMEVGESDGAAAGATGSAGGAGGSLGGAAGEDGDGQLISEEERESGRVSLAVYWQYMTKAMGGWHVPLLLLVQLAWQALQIGSDLWLATYSSAGAENSSAEAGYTSAGAGFNKSILSNLTSPLSSPLASSLSSSSFTPSFSSSLSSSFSSPLSFLTPSAITPSAFMKLYSLLALGSGLFVLLRTAVISWAGVMTTQAFFRSMQQTVFRAPMSFFDSTPIGRILSRASTDQSALDLDLPFQFGSLLAMVFQLLGILFVTSYITWPVFYAIIPLTYLYFSFQEYYLMTSRELSRLNGVTKAPIIEHFSESLSGAAVIRAFAQQPRFAQKSAERVDTNNRVAFHYGACTVWLGVHLELLGALLLCFSAFMLVWLPPSVISPGLAGMSLSYGLALSQGLFYVVWVWCALENQMVSVERILQFSHPNVPPEPPLSIPSHRPPSSWPDRGAITFENLQIRYRPDLPLVLKGVSLQINGGEKVGVVGRTGSGKSTLVVALFRLVEPTAGRVVIDGVDTTRIGLTDLRSRLAIIPQDPTLFQGSVRMNVDPAGEYRDEEIWEALDRCQLGEVVRGMEEKLEAQVVEGGENWSVGQRQLFCLGRALLKRTRILVLDEATASVDSATDAVIQRTIKECFGDATIISIAHRIATVIDSNKVVVMDQGTVAECDEPAKLLEDKTSMFSRLVAEYSARSTDMADVARSTSIDNLEAVGRESSS
ncbi:unnamed protein product, partial [Closterium sp. NIES-64]